MSEPKCSLPSCKRTSAKVCSRCNTELYCSRLHQMAHWKIHKCQCKPYTGKNEKTKINFPIFIFLSFFLFSKHERNYETEKEKRKSNRLQKNLEHQNTNYYQKKLSLARFCEGTIFQKNKNSLTILKYLRMFLWK